MLKGKSVIVTGSTSGIGLGLARAFAAQGCQVMLNGFGEAADIAKLCAELSALSGGRVLHHPANMLKPDEIADLVATAAREFDGVDILCNNAGIQHTAPVHEFPADKWDAIIAINLSAAFHAVQHALPHMKKQGWGRLINTASAHGLVASINKAAYVSAKHGLVGLTKVVALETAGSGITCNAICPGWVRTPLVEVQIEARAQNLGLSLEDAARNLLSEKQPSQQFVQVEHIGQLAVFLCSEAASQMTGSILTMDGGWTAQ